MPSLNIEKRSVGNGVIILDCNGRFALGEEASCLKKTVHELVAEEEGKILLNLREVGYVDSSGLYALTSSFTEVKKEGGSLKLLNTTQKLQDLLAITKLLTVFETFDNEEEAIASFC